MQYYCGSPTVECEAGKQAYYAWLNKLGLDDTKPYRWPQEKFSWAKPWLEFIKEDKYHKYYKVWALFPGSSMNNTVYSMDELQKAARSLVGRPVNINHETEPLEGVEIVDAEYEDGAVECLIRVRKDAQFNGQEITQLIDQGEILHVSIEAQCRTGSLIPGNGFACQGLVLTGLALLTRDTLPGIPLTRIEPVEKIVEKFAMEKEKENREVEEQIKKKCYLCGRPLTDSVSLGKYLVHPQCARKFWEIAMDIFHFSEKAVAVHHPPLADPDREWDADAAVNRIRKWASSDGSGDKEKIDWNKYRQAFAWYNAEDPENFGSYKLPHHDVVNGRLVTVWRGVVAAMQALLGARGGVDIPTSDRRAVYRHLAAHYEDFDKEPPEMEYKIEQTLETENRMLKDQIEKLQEKIKGLCEEKKKLEQKLRKTKRYSRIILNL